MAPREQGGIGLFDLEARNEALLMLKAASLAETDPEIRSHWASLALHGLSKHVVKTSSVAEDAKTNIMVQNLKVNQRDPPVQHKALVKCLNKYGVDFAAIHPTAEIQREMPLWHHPGEDRRKRQGNNSKKAKCLRSNHAALKVGDGLDLAQRLENPLHSPAATSRLGQIFPKWIPKPEVADGQGSVEAVGGASYYDAQERRTKRTRQPATAEKDSGGAGPGNYNRVYCRGGTCTTTREFVTCPASAAGASLVTPQNDAAHVRHVVPHAPLALDLSHLKSSTVTPGPRPQRLGALWASTAFKSSAASPRGLESSSAGANVTHWLEERVIAPHAVVDSRLAFHIIVLTLKTIEKEESSTSSLASSPARTAVMGTLWATSGSSAGEGMNASYHDDVSPPVPAGIDRDGVDPKSALLQDIYHRPKMAVSLSQPPLESSALSHMAITLGNFGG
ncbi:hypothetical protein B0H13DRAFT_2313912 [Mycena leptocephala]|nr:hypothetical protein B0H13DRAFT_2313912 [Mycena leptocephala]